MLRTRSARASGATHEFIEYMRSWHPTRDAADFASHRDWREALGCEAALLPLRAAPKMNASGSAGGLLLRGPLRVGDDQFRKLFARNPEHIA